MPPEVTKNFAPQYSVFDAFCGWGGLSYGLALTGRFRTLLGNDILPEAVFVLYEPIDQPLNGLIDTLRAVANDLPLEFLAS